MTNGIENLRQVQMGAESPAGTVATPTANWYGTGVIQDDRVRKYVKEHIGRLSGRGRSHTPKLGASLLLESVEATFEQFPYLCEMGIKTVAATQDGTGSGYIYEYPFPSTATQAIKSYTFYTGDNARVKRMEYSFLQDMTLTGDEGEAWMMSANLIGRQSAVSSFATTLTLSVPEEMEFQNTKLYIDAATASYGSTIQSNTLLAAQFTYKTNIQAVFAADGQRYFSFPKMKNPLAQLKLTFEHDAIGTAQEDNWLNDVPLLVRLITEGEALTTPGVAYTYKTFIIDLAGKFDKFNKIGTRNGNDVIEGMFTGYDLDETAGDMGKIIVVNELAALP